MSEDPWFKNAATAMIAGLGWFLVAELMFRIGVDRISDDFYIGSGNPLLRLMVLHLFVYFVAVVVAAIVAVRLFLVVTKSAGLDAILPGIAMAGSLRVLVALDSGLQPTSWWYETARFLIVTLVPAALFLYMRRRKKTA